MFNVNAWLSSIYQQIDLFSFWTDVSFEWNKQCYIWNYQQLVMSAKSQQPKLAKTLLSGLLYYKTDSYKVQLHFRVAPAHIQRTFDLRTITTEMAQAQARLAPVQDEFDRINPYTIGQRFVGNIDAIIAWCRQFGLLATIMVCTACNARCNKQINKFCRQDWPKNLKMYE